METQDKTNKTPRASYILYKCSAIEVHLWPFTTYFKAKKIIRKLKLLYSRRAIGCVWLRNSSTHNPLPGKITTKPNNIKKPTHQIFFILNPWVIPPTHRPSGLVLFFFYFIYECFICVYVCTQCACLMPNEATRGHWFVSNGIKYRQSWVAM